MPKLLIAIGVIFIITGVLWHLGVFKYIPLGRLPGDIAIENENSKFYFPLTTSILLSILLSIALYIFRQFKS